jgi:hypothetical protein
MPENPDNPNKKPKYPPYRRQPGRVVGGMNEAHRISPELAEAIGETFTDEEIWEDDFDQACVDMDPQDVQKLLGDPFGLRAHIDKLIEGPKAATSVPEEGAVVLRDPEFAAFQEGDMSQPALTLEDLETIEDVGDPEEWMERRYSDYPADDSLSWEQMEELDNLEAEGEAPEPTPAPDLFGTGALLDHLRDNGIDPDTISQFEANAAEFNAMAAEVMADPKHEQIQAALAKLFSDPEKLLAMPADELQELLINTCTDGSPQEKAQLRQREIGVEIMETLKTGQEPDQKALAELIAMTLSGQTDPIPE